MYLTARLLTVGLSCAAFALALRHRFHLEPPPQPRIWGVTPLALEYQPTPAECALADHLTPCLEQNVVEATGVDVGGYLINQAGVAGYIVGKEPRPS